MRVGANWWRRVLAVAAGGGCLISLAACPSRPHEMVTPDFFGFSISPTELVYCSRDAADKTVGIFLVTVDSGPSSDPFELSFEGPTLKSDVDGANLDAGASQAYSLEAIDPGDQGGTVTATNGNYDASIELLVFDRCGKPMNRLDPLGDQTDAELAQLDLHDAVSGKDADGSVWLMVQNALPLWPPTGLYSWYLTVTLYDSGGTQLGSVTVQQHDGKDDRFFDGNLDASHTTIEAPGGTGPLFTFDKGTTNLKDVASFSLESGFEETSAGPISRDVAPDSGVWTLVMDPAEVPKP